MILIKTEEREIQREREREREREGEREREEWEQAVCKTSNFPLFLRSKLPP